MKKYLNNRFAFYVISIIVFTCISFRIPLIADDFGYSLSRLTGERLNNITQVIPSVWHEYMTWEGRLLCFFIGQMCLIGDDQLIFRLLYPFINLAVILLIRKLINDDDDDFYLVYPVMSLLMGANILMLNQTMFWIIGWSTYVVSLIPLLIVLTYCKKSIDSNESDSNSLLFLCLCALSACLFVEHYSLLVAGFCIITFIKEKYSHNVSKTTVALLASSIIGNAIIFLSPGMFYRAGQDMLTGWSILEKLHFGWSRFIYTFFYMNQRIMVVMAVMMVLALWKNKNRFCIIKCMLLVPVILFSSALIVFPQLINPVLLESLTGEWSFYTVSLPDLLKGTIVVLYYIVVFSFVIFSELFEMKTMFNSLLYCALLCTGFCFLLSNTACERTMFIQYVFFIVIALSYFVQLDNKLITNCFVFLCIALLTYSSCKYISAYSAEWKIYKENDLAYRGCALNGCPEVAVKEHNYRYVFKSDLNFEEQDTWFFNDIRKYYGMPMNATIIPK